LPWTAWIRRRRQGDIRQHQYRQRQRLRLAWLSHQRQKIRGAAVVGPDQVPPRRQIVHGDRGRRRVRPAEHREGGFVDELDGATGHTAALSCGYRRGERDAGVGTGGIGGRLQRDDGRL